MVPRALRAQAVKPEAALPRERRVLEEQPGQRERPGHPEPAVLCRKLIPGLRVLRALQATRLRDPTAGRAKRRGRGHPNGDAVSVLAQLPDRYFGSA